MAFAGSDAQLIVRTPELAPPVTFDASTLAWLRGKPAIRVAYWRQPLAPLYTDLEPNEFEGVTADVLGLLQQTLGVPLQMLRFEGRNEALLAMAKGEFDMLALNDVTADKQQLFRPSRRYLLNRRVMVRRVNEIRQTRASPSGERLAYISTTDSKVKQLQAQYPQSTLVPYTGALSAISGLAYDQTDIFCTDAVTAQFLISRFYRNDVYVVDDVAPVLVTDLNFAVSVRQPQLLDAINQSLVAIPVVSMLRITSRWGLSDNVVFRTSLNLSPEQAA
ncbi:transporter substrate-binding domain-containing protein [Pseudomonas kielensis]|uniref:transporter substrate-binding domain-containing protein n=1 Tax=Pseudomonas kielensis TaxID=2762577 RepID=UPI00224093FC|nr:transporter substrate-binding domain-containing protein [Pseudomonas kielensis]UZM16318.1 transporter substrate-binding domain-containing protein [Pseudomonas kielensis]